MELYSEPNEMFYSILFDVSIKKYPQFKISQRGDLIGVSGEIIKCSGEGLYVELEIDDIIFHENKQEEQPNK